MSCDCDLKVKSGPLTHTAVTLPAGSPLVVPNVVAPTWAGSYIQVGSVVSFAGDAHIQLVPSALNTTIAGSFALYARQIERAAGTSSVWSNGTYAFGTVTGVAPGIPGAPPLTGIMHSGVDAAGVGVITVFYQFGHNAGGLITTPVTYDIAFSGQFFVVPC